MLTGVGSTATFAVGLAFSGDTRGKGAFFAGFFLIVLVFLTVVAFLRVAALMPCFFLRLAWPLAFFVVAATTSLDAHWILRGLRRLLVRPYIFWNASAARNTVPSSQCRPISIMPTGNPADKPAGTVIAGWPVTSKGQVLESISSARAT